MVGEDLNLDVTRAQHAPLEIHRWVAKRCGSFGASQSNSALQVLGLRYDTHPLATATGDRLDQDRISDPAAAAGDRPRRKPQGRTAMSVPGTTGTPADAAICRAVVLLPTRATDSGVGPMKINPASRQAPRTLRSRRGTRIQDGWRQHLWRGPHRDAIDAKVAVRRGIATNRDRLVGHAHVTGRAIAFGKHRHRPEAEIAARANDAYRDLPAVGDEDLVQDPRDSTLGTCDNR